ncbi:hypothetical protein VT84_27050 [Gemmata sp. SH-PL17]|nr:hypothetical protein VT84_27050 [Gemmata sp. SH-PL17]
MFALPPTTRSDREARFGKMAKLGPVGAPIQGVATGPNGYE